MLNAAGTAAVYSTYIGGPNEDGANGVAVDARGNAYVGGHTRSPSFPVTGGAADTVCDSCAPFPQPDDAFALKLDPTGALVYSTLLGGPEYDQAYSIGIDSSGNAYLSGGIANNGCSFP